MADNDFFDPIEQEPIPENDSEDVLAEVENLLKEDNSEEIPEVEDNLADLFGDAEAENGETEESTAENADDFARSLDELLGNPLSAEDAAEGETEQMPPQESAMEESGAVPVSEEFRDQEYRDIFGDDLDRAFGDVPEEPEQEEPERPARRNPPQKPKKGSGLFGIPHFLATIIYFVVILAISVTLARILWLCADDVLALTKQDKAVSVTIAESDTLDDIADKLVDAGLVRYKKVFLLYGSLSNAREKISSGTFELNSLYDYHALISGMSRYASNRAEVTVMIPEGYNCRQIFELLEEKGVCSVKDLEEAAVEGEFEGYWFLNGVERKDKYCLEGYLFPDTYDFYEDDDAERVIGKMLDNFDYRFRDSMQDMIPQLNERLAEMMRKNGYDEDYIESHRITIREIVIVASLIEKETAMNSESPIIASVIYNRLTNAADYPYLNIDATILYALGEHKEKLTAEDLKIDSPYNTYNHPGLPIGPISNPGIASLQAALDPDDTNYHYYALDASTGSHHFSETIDEHNAFLAGQE